jgi:hypothetical protein
MGTKTIAVRIEAYERLRAARRYPGESRSARSCFVPGGPRTPLRRGNCANWPAAAERTHWEEFLGAFHILAFTADVAWEYGRAYRYLRGNQLPFCANDLWIAATALAYRMPLVTRNLGHFRRVPDLQLADYRP